jgi:hypothetical protein
MIADAEHAKIVSFASRLLALLSRLGCCGRFAAAASRLSSPGEMRVDRAARALLNQTDVVQQGLHTRTTCLDTWMRL